MNSGTGMNQKSETVDEVIDNMDGSTIKEVNMKWSDIKEFPEGVLVNILLDDDETPLKAKRLSFLTRKRSALKILEKMTVDELRNITDYEVLQMFGYRNRPCQPYWSKCWQAVEYVKQVKIKDLIQDMKSW